MQSKTKNTVNPTNAWTAKLALTTTNTTAARRTAAANVATCACAGGSQDQHLPHRWPKGGGHARGAHDAAEQRSAAVPAKGPPPGLVNRPARRQGSQASREAHRLREERRKLAGHRRARLIPPPDAARARGTALATAELTVATTAVAVVTGDVALSDLANTGVPTALTTAAAVASHPASFAVAAAVAAVAVLRDIGACAPPTTTTADNFLPDTLVATRW